MSTPTACLLLSQFAPATAQLLGEFQRLRKMLSPAEARICAAHAEGDLQDADMKTMVRLCACHISRTPRRLRGCQAICSKTVPAPPLYHCKRSGLVARLSCMEACWSMSLVPAAMSSYLIPAVPIRAQTLQDMLAVEGLMVLEQRDDPAVLAAKVESMTWMPLAMLMIDALGSSGAEPKRACWPVNRHVRRVSDAAAHVRPCSRACGQALDSGRTMHAHTAILHAHNGALNAV